MSAVSSFQSPEGQPGERDVIPGAWDEETAYNPGYSSAKRNERCDILQLTRQLTRQVEQNFVKSNEFFSTSSIMV